MSITRPQLAFALARAAAWAGITLIDPNQLDGWRKHAYWLTMAAGAGAEVARPMPDDETYAPPGLTVGTALATAGITYGAHEVLARGDSWSVGLLRRMGLKQPRVWAAVTVFAAAMAGALAEAKLTSTAAADEDEGLVTPHPAGLGPVPDEIRTAVEHLLDAVDGHGAEELRRQLDAAVCRIEDGLITFVADPGAPRTLIELYTFPASAIFERDGVNHVLLLEIEGGTLSYLSHLIEPYPQDDKNLDWSLPSPDEMRIVVGFEEIDAAE